MKIEADSSWVLSQNILLKTLNCNLEQLIPIIMILVFLFHELEGPEVC